MEQVLLRREHGNTFVTQLPDGLSIPWKPLPIGEFLEYEQARTSGEYPTALLEDEIFKKCVTDAVLVRYIDKLKAGIVSTVVGNIMSISGPGSLEELNYLLNVNREKANQLLHQLVLIILQAFPAYKPEDIYAMDFHVFMLRVAQAEAKGLTTGMMKQPLEFLPPESQEKKPASLPRVPFVPPKSTPMTPKPVLPISTKQTVISKADITEHAMIDESDPIKGLLKIEETAQLAYSNYIEQMKRGEKIKILTPEERKIAAEARSEAHKKQLIEERKQFIKETLEQKDELLAIRDKARARKAKKLAAKKQ